MDLDSNVVGVDASVIGGVVSACDSGCRSGDPTCRSCGLLPTIVILYWYWCVLTKEVELKHFQK